MKKIFALVLIVLFIVSTVNVGFAASVTDLSREISNLDNLTNEERSELQEDLLELINEEVLTIEEAINEIKDTSVKDLESGEEVTVQILSKTKNINQEKINNLLKSSEDKEDLRETLKEAFEKGMTSEEINEILENKTENMEQLKEKVEKKIEAKEKARERAEEEKDEDDDDDE